MYRIFTERRMIYTPRTIIWHIFSTLGGGLLGSSSSARVTLGVFGGDNARGGGIGESDGFGWGLPLPHLLLRPAPRPGPSRPRQRPALRHGTLLPAACPPPDSPTFIHSSPPKEDFPGVRSTGRRTITERMSATADNSYSSTRYIFCLSRLYPNILADISRRLYVQVI